MTRLFHCTVTHTRRSTMARRFSYSTCYWLVDVDAPPTLPRWLRPFAQFRAQDHLGDPEGSLAGNIREYLAEHGERPDRIELLTCPRVLGHVFNPLSVYYCTTAGRPTLVVAEVHNTYGGRHAYLLRPDESGRDQVDKKFYVSPFLPMGGRYLMRMPTPGDRLQVAVALRMGERTPFVATLTGAGHPATLPHILFALARWPVATLRTAALIRWQGIRLWLRGAPVQARPADATGSETARPAA